MFEKNRKQIKTLKQKINSVRHRLQTYWDNRGYTDSDVLKVSIELDLLLNEYHELLDQKPKNTE